MTDGKADFVAEPNKAGGYTVFCRDCGHSVLGRDPDGRFEPTAACVTFLRSLGRKIVCTRCRCEVTV
jgi:hypothetical protein